MKLILSLAGIAIFFNLMTVVGQNRVFNNPIIPGFYPDPSICRVGENYYLVNSSFEYFPGSPIFQSKDLVHWKQIGNILDRPNQLALDSVKYGVSGIFAPSIRYHNGTYFMTTTMIGSHNPQRGGNFIVTAKMPEGPWSDPFFLDNAPGIDPCIFFDSDDKAYFIGARMANDKEKKYWKHSIIWMRELDLNKMQLLGDEIVILEQGGALHHARNAESPRLFKRNGYYYLIIAEGGTGKEHAVTVFRSKDIRGPYETNLRNPILTNRHMGLKYPIQSVGHADLVETPLGEWWMVVLGTRPDADGTINLARETFLVPMIWENDWPVASPVSGCVSMQCQAPRLPVFYYESEESKNNFDKDSLPLYWNYIRLPESENYSLKERKGYLRLHLSAITLKQELSPTFVGRRQQHSNCLAETFLEFVPNKNGESAGLVVFQSPECYYKLEKTKRNERNCLVLTKCDKGEECIQEEVEYTLDRVGLRVIALGQRYSFFYSVDGEEWNMLGDIQDGRILNAYYNGKGFTGLYIGMYASSNGSKSSLCADFDSFEYRECFVD